MDNRFLHLDGIDGMDRQIFRSIGLELNLFYHLKFTKVRPKNDENLCKIPKFIDKKSSRESSIKVKKRLKKVEKKRLKKAQKIQISAKKVEKKVQKKNSNKKCSKKS